MFEKIRSPFARPSVAALIALIFVLGLVPELWAADDDEQEPPGKTDYGTFGLALRYRFEWADDDAFADQGYASTLRSVLNYKTPSWHELALVAQFVDVANLGAADEHNDTLNGVTDRPVIPDPESASLAQILLRYDGLVDTSFMAGRQEIALDNQRFVGPVGWRQTHQTLDSARVVQRSIPHTTWTYAYVSKANTVTTRTDPMSTNLFNAAIEIGEAGTLSPYYYSIDYDDAPRTDFSTSSYGARWKGACKLGSWSLPYVVEAAHQADIGDNPGTVDADYYHLVAGAKRNDLWFNLGLEVLGGSAADGQFNTPLATIHAFNGWADKFLVTPTDGLEDLYVAVGDKLGQVSVEAVLHDFRSDTLGLSYGTEIDAQASYTAPWKQVFALTLAYYDADELDEDTFKLWVWSTYQF